MRILALNWQDLKNPQAGGAEVHLEEILKRLVAYGHQVDLLCSNYPDGSKTDNTDGINIFRHGSRFNFNLVAPFALRTMISKTKYDAVIEDINKIPFYSPLYQNLPTLVVIPHLFADTVYQEINFVLGTYIFLAEKPVPVVYRNKRFMVISKSTADDVERRGIERGLIDVVECGIDKEIYRFDPSVPKFDVPTMLYIGRLKKYKNVEIPIKAMPLIRQTVPNARLVIVGSGDYQPNLERLSQSMGLESCVEFKGFIPQSDKINYLRRSHISVYPSLKEGWGLTNIEANACGTAVLASRVPGLQDSVDEGKSGLLFKFGDIEGLSALACKMFTDDGYRRGLEMGGLRWAANFSWDKTARATEEILNRIVSAQ
jgi:glycosyltransferase involved in cell wall biosynthesis